MVLADLTTNKKMGTSVYSLRKLNSDNQLNELEENKF